MRQYIASQPNRHLQLVARLAGHQGVVRALAWSPDGRTLVTGGKDGRLLCWEAANPRHGQLIGKHAGWSTALAWPTEDLLVSGSSGGQLYGWDLTSTARQRWARSLHRSRVTALALTLDGQLASADGGGTILVSDLADGRETLRLAGHQGAVTDLAAHPSAPLLASVGEDMRLRLWDLTSGAVQATIVDHTWYAATVGWSAAGRWLASGSLDETIRLYDGDSLTALATLGHFPDWVRCLRWHPQRPLLACGCKDGRLWLWDMAALRCLSTVEAHRASLVALAWSPDGRTLASASEDSTACLWQRTEDTQ